MLRVGFVYHPDYLKHETGFAHPESPSRLQAILNYLESMPLAKELKFITPTAANVEWIYKIHTPEYVQMIKDRCERGDSVLDFGDTHVCEDSYNAAILSAGGVLTAIDEVLDKEKNIDSVFCAVRPPGHHAETNRVMGFCLFNNVAIGARYAQLKHGCERIAIIDWDVHHGNGTQHSFYDDSTVLYISLHQYPFYPGTGAANEIGKGSGQGFTLNCPMNAGSSDADYLEAFDQKILPSLQSFQPELIMVSAGFDAHKDDPLANILLTDNCFIKMTELLMDVASKYCHDKIISVLEGGYNIDALSRCVYKHIITLAGK